MFAVLAPLLAKLFAVLAAGTLLRAHLPPRTRSVIHRFIIDGAMPLLLLLVLAGIRIDPGVVVAALPVSIAQLCMAGLALALAAGFGLSREARGSAAVTTSFANTGFLGFPVTLALWDADATAAATAIAIDTVCTTVWLWSFGVILAARFGHGRPFSWSTLLRALMRPITICIAIGIALSTAGIGLPAGTTAFAGGLGMLVSVLVFFALGLSLDLGALRGRLAPLAAMSGLKLLGMPLIVLAVARGLGLPDVVIIVAVLQSAMPSAMTGVVIATDEGCDGVFAAGVAALSTLLCIATLPVVAWVLESATAGA
jgi:predicted permease